MDHLPGPMAGPVGSDRARAGCSLPLRAEPRHRPMALDQCGQPRGGGGLGGLFHAVLLVRGELRHRRRGVLAWIALMRLGLGPGASWHTVTAILGGCAVLSVTIFCGYAIVFSTAPM